MTSKDEEFCDELGLSSPPEGEGDHYLGRVKIDDEGSFIDVTSQSNGAYFFDLAVYSQELGAMYSVFIGTGELHEFWPFAEALALNEIQVTLNEPGDLARVTGLKPQHPAE